MRIPENDHFSTRCRMGREHCQFQCKRGLTLYAWCSRHGLFRKTI